jgi:DNA-binding NarL/FixJ family response regulator
MRKEKLSILIVDDNENYVQRMKRMLYELDNVSAIFSANSYEEAFNQLDTYVHDMVLLDINLPGKSGISLLKKIKERKWPCVVIMISNFSAATYKEQCKKLGARYFLDKTGEFEKVPIIVAGMPLADMITSSIN